MGRLHGGGEGGFCASCTKTPRRCRLVAEWKALIRRDKVSQVATPSGGRQPADEAIRETARQLGLSKDDVHRAIKVASITPEAQQAAHEVGNRWATKSKQLLASASRWVQLVGIWWTSLIPARQNCFTQKRVARLPH